VDLSDLSPVLTAPGPFVTVHVGAELAAQIHAELARHAHDDGAAARA